MGMDMDMETGTGDAAPDGAQLGLPSFIGVG